MAGGEGECCRWCGVVRYCSSSCRDQAWPSHSHLCHTVTRERHCDDIVRLIATICRKVRSQERSL